VTAQVSSESLCAKRILLALHIYSPNESSCF
jgi:hypothetical protein